MQGMRNHIPGCLLQKGQGASAVECPGQRGRGTEGRCLAEAMPLLTPTPPRNDFDQLRQMLESGYVILGETLPLSGPRDPYLIGSHRAL